MTDPVTADIMKRDAAWFAGIGGPRHRTTCRWRVVADRIRRCIRPGDDVPGSARDHPDLKEAVIGQCAQALRPGGQVLIFDERYASKPSELRDPLLIYAVMGQWYELTWGNIVNTREEIHELLIKQGLRVADETSLSRFYIVTAEKN